jgi:hypothetical protein
MAKGYFEVYQLTIVVSAFCPGSWARSWPRMLVDCVWNVMAHAQKPDFVFWRNRRVHLNRRGRQFSRLLAAEVCASAVVMLDAPCSGVVWRVLATHSIRQFPLHFPSRASPCVITFQLDSTSACAYEHESSNLEQRPKFAYYVCSLKDLSATK